MLLPVRKLICIYVFITSFSFYATNLTKPNQISSLKVLSTMFHLSPSSTLIRFIGKFTFTIRVQNNSIKLLFDRMENQDHDGSITLIRAIKGSDKGWYNSEGKLVCIGVNCLIVG